MKCFTDHLKNRKTKNNLVGFNKNITFITPPPTTTNQTLLTFDEAASSSSRFDAAFFFYFESIYIWRARLRHSVIQQHLLMCVASDLRLKEPAHIRARSGLSSPELRAKPTQRTKLRCQRLCFFCALYNSPHFQVQFWFVVCFNRLSEPVTRDFVNPFFT